MGSHVVLSYCFTSSSGPSAIACLFLLILLRFLIASAWVGTGDLSSAASPSCTQFFCVIALRYAKQQWLLLFCFQKDRNPDPSITLYPMQKLQESDIFSFFFFFFLITEAYRVVLDTFLVSLAIAMLFSLLYFWWGIYAYLCTHCELHITHRHRVNMWFYFLNYLKQ